MPQMANPQHGDLELTRGKESSIWAIKLTKELRNNKELASTYLLEPPTRRKSSLKPALPLFFPILDFWGASSPSKQFLVGMRKKGVCSFWWLFLGAGGGWTAAKNPFVGVGHPHPPLQMGVVFRDGVGVAKPPIPRKRVGAAERETRPYKLIFWDRSIGTVHPLPL